MSDAQAKPPTEAELELWRGLAEAATPGPWCASNDPNDDHPDYWWVGVNGTASVATGFLGRDAAFVAASRDAVPRLLAAIEERDGVIADMVYESDARALAVRLRAENGRLREALGRIMGLWGRQPAYHDGPSAYDDATVIVHEALGESPPSP